ncbi:MAG: phytoene desaturase family protein, partial [Fidelibacterota bacterium]
FVTFKKLMPAGSLPEEFMFSIEEMDFTSPAAKMNVLLSELPDFTALPGVAPGPQHMGTIHISPTMGYLERAYDDAKYGMPSMNPMVECTLPTSIDDTLAPEGKHLMGLFCQYAPYELKGTTWDSEKENFAHRIIDTVTEVAPNFRRSVLDYELLTPQDMERIFGLTGGNIFHGSMTLNQLFFMRPVLGWSDYRTPIKGLYLCGSGTHPGGGVTGAPGRNTSRVILSELK